jgi:cytidylate kinase
MPKQIAELVSRQMQRSELARHLIAESGTPCETPLITISRTMGSGARIVAEVLTHDLGWSFWGKEVIDAIAENADVSRSLVEGQDERKVSELEAFAKALMGDYEMSSFMYGKHLARIVAAIGARGCAIILGRGARFLLPDALHVHIDASFDYRVANMMKFEDYNRADAEAKLRASDKERRQFVEAMFGRDRVNSFHYDVSIWMDRLTIDGAAAIIKAALESHCKRTSSSSKHAANTSPGCG